MCNTINPIPGRIYLSKGISPSLNTCGGENTDVSMDKAEVPPPIIVATLKDRTVTYNSKICQTIRSNSHGAIPHFIWIEPKR